MPDLYHVMGANGLRGIQTEVDKRAEAGWRLHTAYQETSGGFFGFFGRRHILIFILPELTYEELDMLEDADNEEIEGETPPEAAGAAAASPEPAAVPAFRPRS